MFSDSLLFIKMNIIASCVLIVNSTFSLINATLVIHYDINQSHECDFFHNNEVFVYVFDICENGEICNEKMAYTA